MTQISQTELEQRSAAGLQVRLERSPERLRDSWEALAERLSAPPFLRPGWIFAWSRAFAAGELSALAALREGELVGVLPFVQRKGVVSAPVNWHTPLYGFLATDRHVSASLAAELLGRARVRADLGFVDAADPHLADCMDQARAGRRSVVVRTVMRSPCVQLSGNDWDAYRASLDRKDRKDVERRMRRLEEQGTVSFGFGAPAGGLEQALEEGFALEGSGWKHTRGSAIASERATHRFYSEVAGWAATHGWLDLAFLRLDGKAIAFDMCLRVAGVTYVLKGGFDPEFRRFAPGMLLTYESLRRALQRGDTSYELLGKDDPYKLVWTRSSRELVRFQAFSPSPRGRANHLAWTRGRAIALSTLQAARGAKRLLKSTKPNSAG